MKFKLTEKVEQGLFCKLGCIVHDTSIKLGINEAPYTYEDGFYIDAELNENSIKEILKNTFGWLTIDNSFVFDRSAF